MPEEKKEEGLKNHTVVLMIVVALFFDVLQWALAFIFMDWLVSIFAYLTFFVWFRMNGISFMKPKRLAASSLSFLFEIFSWVAAIPALTAAVTFVALDAKVKKIVAQVPGGGMALSVASNKVIHNRNMAQVNNMERLKLKPSSGNPEEIRAASKKRGAEFNTKIERDKKKSEERNKQWEESRQRQRKFEEDYGGYQKYDKDLSELKFKYSDSEWKRRKEGGGDLGKEA